jgi:hypothetical protein
MTVTGNQGIACVSVGQGTAAHLGTTTTADVPHRLTALPRTSTHRRTGLRSATPAQPARRDKRHCPPKTNVTVCPEGGGSARETNAIVRHARPAKSKKNQTYDRGGIDK